MPEPSACFIVLSCPNSSAGRLPWLKSTTLSWLKWSNTNVHPAVDRRHILDRGERKWSQRPGIAGCSNC